MKQEIEALSQRLPMFIQSTDALLQVTSSLPGAFGNETLCTVGGAWSTFKQPALTRLSVAESCLQHFDALPAVVAAQAVHRAAISSLAAAHERAELERTSDREDEYDDYEEPADFVWGAEYDLKDAWRNVLAALSRLKVQGHTCLFESGMQVLQAAMEVSKAAALVRTALMEVAKQRGYTQAYHNARADYHNHLAAVERNMQDLAKALIAEPLEPLAAVDLLFELAGGAPDAEGEADAELRQTYASARALLT